MKRAHCTADPPTCPHTDAHAALEGRIKFIPKMGFRFNQWKRDNNNKKKKTSKQDVTRHVKGSFPTSCFHFSPFSVVPPLASFRSVEFPPDTRRFIRPATKWQHPVGSAEFTCAKYLQDNSLGAWQPERGQNSRPEMCWAERPCNDRQRCTSTSLSYAIRLSLFKNTIHHPILYLSVPPLSLGYKVSTLITICRSRKAESATMTPPSAIRCQAAADSGLTATGGKIATPHQVSDTQRPTK